MSEPPVNAAPMEPDDLSSKRHDDLLAQLARQDLDPLSVEELEARIVALQAEIKRSRGKAAAAIHHRASADALFRR